MWRPSKEWFEWVKRLPVDGSPMGVQITREEAVDLFKEKTAEEIGKEIIEELSKTPKRCVGYLTKMKQYDRRTG